MTIEHIKKTALAAYMLQHGSHPTIIYAGGTRGETLVVLEDQPDDFEANRKYLFTKGATLAMKEESGVLLDLFLASEAWLRMVEQKTATEKAKRVEALVIYSLSLTTKAQRMFIFEIIRDAQGIVRELTPFQGQEEMKAVSNPVLLSFLAGYTFMEQEKVKRAT